MNVSCSTCGEEVPYEKAHRFEESLPGGRTKEFRVCVRCCPNCFGSVGRDNHNTPGEEPPTLTIP